MADYWFVIVPAALLLVPMAAFVAKRAGRYRKLYDPEQFRQVHTKFPAAIKAAEENLDTGEEPNLADGSAFVTTEGLAVAVTVRRSEESRVLHISISQAGEHTTSAVASRFGFFLVAMLGENEMTLDPFFTPSRVHHLVFTHHADALSLKPFDETMERYVQSYRPIPYVLQAS